VVKPKEILITPSAITTSNIRQRKHCGLPWTISDVDNWAPQFEEFEVDSSAIRALEGSTLSGTTFTKRGWGVWET
jgi:hypothetical protein